MQEHSAPASEVLKLRERALAGGAVVVTLPDGSTEVRDPAPPTPRERKRRRKRREPDPFVTTAKRDRPMLPEQKAELAALSRDPLLNFDLQLTRTLTRGQADSLIGRLRKVAKTRQTAQRHKQRQQTKPTKRRQILVVK